LLKSKDNEQKLSPKEGALLRLLSEYLNDVMPREKALKGIWSEDNYFTTRSMNVYITKLRKYLQLHVAVQIENVHSSGYRLHVN
jgi:DNA-binding response OmpR family regulator